MKHLIRGSDYLASKPNFKLVGRDTDLACLCSILMRKHANSVLLVGPAGVGVSTLGLGLQYIKNIPGTPFDIINKRLFFLDSNSLFSSGDGNEINKEFQKILKILYKTPESVLIIEDTYDFIEASRTSGNPHFIQALNLAVKSKKTEVILEVRDEQLQHVLKWHSDINEEFTLYDLKEPAGGDLFEIVKGVAETLSKYHRISISDEAINTAISLTTKYRDTTGLVGAQPARSINLLDRAFASYRLKVHKKHPLIAQMEERYEAVLVLEEETEKHTGFRGNIDNGRAKADLEDMVSKWAILQEKIKHHHDEQRTAEEKIFELEAEIETLQEKQQKRYEDGAEKTEAAASFAELIGGGFETKEVQALRKEITKFEIALEENRKEHDRLVDIANKDLCLNAKDVMIEFSQISGVSTDKLAENELEKLRNLETNMLARVFGQDDVVRQICNGVKVAKIDSGEESGPAAAYMLLGPSGVGKTETAKALAQNLIGSEAALERFDMSEYMEKHAVAKLIGAPPGYEGFEAGGILTNTVRKKPVGIFLFDEIEKAHPDVFNIFLQILSDGRLTDNIGRTVDFRDIIIIMTSNIGQSHYLNMSLSEDDAKELATEELNDTYRSELLNRFNGRENILHFHRLKLPTIEKIVNREFKKLDENYSRRGLNIRVSGEAVANFCKDHYDAVRGARGLPGYIKANVRPIIVNHILNDPDKKGTFKIEYNTESKTFEVEFIEKTNVE